CRAGGLRPGALQAWFDGHRPVLEMVVDGFWAALAGLFFVGVGVAVARRRWGVLALLPLPLSLVGVYVLYFAEVRYQLPIVGLMFPVAAGGLVWLVRRGRALLRERRLQPPVRRELGWAAVGLALLLAGWPTLLWAGERL